MKSPSGVESREIERFSGEEKVLLFGEVTKEDLLILEIKTSERDPEYYLRLARGLNIDKIRDAMRFSIEQGNISAFIGLCRANVHAALDFLTSYSKPEVIIKKAVERYPQHAYAVFFMLKRRLPEHIKKIFLNAIKLSLVKRFLGEMRARGPRRRRSFSEQYAVDFDLEATLENYLEGGLKPLRHDDVVWVEKIEKRSACALILDISGSMYGEKNIIAACAAIATAYSLRNSELGIIAFNTSALVLKSIRQEKPISKVLDEILEMEASGYTNIYDGLKKGLMELKTARAKRRWGLLITDGMYNVGSDPRIIARRFPKLHVIALPSNAPHGLNVCRELASLGKGRLTVLRNLNELHAILLDILGKI